MAKINYKAKMPLGMHFKIMYCCKCGNTLDKKSLPKVPTISGVGIPLHRNLLTIYPKGMDRNFGTVTLTKISRNFYVYHCKHCNYLIDYENQKKIRKYQRKSGRLILDKAEIDSLDVSLKA